MKVFAIAAALSVAVSEVSGHYIFQQLGVGSSKFGVFEHIRKNTNYNSPVTGTWFRGKAICKGHQPD